MMVMPEGKKLLPVRVVQPSRDFLHKDERKRGSGSKFFIKDERQFRLHQESLVSELSSIETDLEKTFVKYPSVPSVLKAKLIEDAWAKSHRPNDIFDIYTCPIIGTDNMGELLVSTTKTGLNKLKSRIKVPTSKSQKANITTLKDISEYDKNDKLLGLSVQELMEKSKKGQKIKVILFDHRDPEINNNIKEQFLSWIKEQNLNAKDISNMPGLSIWRILDANEAQIKEMLSNPSIRTVSFFPSFRIILQKDLISSQKIKEFPVPEENMEYPKVAVVDTGISTNNPFLAPWIIDRIPLVPEPYQNNKHGSFVAGLLVMGTQLNGKGICPDEEPIQLVDVQMLPDPKKDTLHEDILIERLRSCTSEVTAKHNVRIWNMSAGFIEKAEDERFSSMGVFLDKLQDENNIIFTLPSGNYEGLNQRSWPPQPSIKNLDKLQIPADSVRAITVGALACKEKPDSIVKIDQPASYSCRGPGPTYIMKPEIVQYSGNLTMDNGQMDYFNQGILSFDERGNIVEGIGTSYSCPLGARTMAILQQKVVESTSNNMIKALMIHTSVIPKGLGKLDEVFPYVGFGKPVDVNSMLNCSESEVTLMFEQEIYQGHNLIYPFAWPKSLINKEGKCRGRVRITLVAGVPLDYGNNGSEYIRANLEVALQAGIKEKNGKIKYSGQLDEYPNNKDLKNYYEKERIKHGFKWKPIKRYEADLKDIKADDWRLKVSILLRSGVKLGTKPVKFALVFSLIDPEGVAPVYNEVILGLRNRNVITNPIQLRARIQEKVQT